LETPSFQVEPRSATRSSPENPGERCVTVGDANRGCPIDANEPVVVTILSITVVPPATPVACRTGSVELRRVSVVFGRSVSFPTGYLVVSGTLWSGHGWPRLDRESVLDVKGVVEWKRRDRNEVVRLNWVGRIGSGGSVQTSDSDGRFDDVPWSGNRGWRTEY